MSTTNDPKTAYEHLAVILGNQIKNERQKRGLSQEEFALIVGVHRTYIGAVERGEKNITIKTLAKFANALKIEIVDLVENL